MASPGGVYELPTYDVVVWRWPVEVKQWAGIREDRAAAMAMATTTTMAGTPMVNVVSVVNLAGVAARAGQ